MHLYALIKRLNELMTLKGVLNAKPSKRVREFVKRCDVNASVLTEATHIKEFKPKSV